MHITYYEGLININPFIVWLALVVAVAVVLVCVVAVKTHTTDQLPYIANEKCTIDRTQLHIQLIYTAKYAPFSVQCIRLAITL